MVESRPVILSDLFATVEGCRLAGAADVHISSLCYRSDQAGEGTLFFCVPGFVRDGHDFAADAVGLGASALCVERLLDLPVAQVVVPSVRHAMGPVAAAFYGRPGSRLLTAGITGTNGKTTSAFLAAHLLDRAGRRTGLMGTVERRVGGKVLPAGRTTPEALDIQRDLADMVAAGDEAVVMEVSSHALDLGRARGIDFRAVAFTNLTQDHLDYHETLEAYFAAKSRLFLDSEFAGVRPAMVINIDDPFGRTLAARCDPQNLIRFSTSGEYSGADAAEMELSDFAIDADGTKGVLCLRGTALELAGGAGSQSHFEVRTRLVGAFNVANALTALGIGLGLGLELPGMLSALREFPGVPGRMEPVDAGQDFTVLVDYAHTPDSVRNVLRTAREITRGRLIAVLGCGGDRDRGKRPQMGHEAEIGADLVIITSDNPRSEKPEAIIADIVAGLKRPSAARVEPDRRRAIAEAMAEARAGDVVLILGKGHESGQEFATETVPFDDRSVAREVLALAGEGPRVIPLSAEEAGHALGLDRPAGPLSSICTDSRRVRPGDLFLALRGERFDGHDFVTEVLAAGASGAVVEKRWWTEGGEELVLAAAAGPDTPLPALADSRQIIYPVEDTVEALGALARAVRRKSTAKVVAVTGSVGKTSTKDLISAMAGRACRVVVTAANQNNEVGVPLTLLAVEPDTELVVVEMGMRGRGQIDALARVAEPDVAVITNIHPVHLELLGTLENVAEAKAELFACLSPSGVAVIPVDCGLLAPYAVAAPCRVIRFGFGCEAGSDAPQAADAAQAAAQADDAAQAADVYGHLRPQSLKEVGVLHLRWPEGEVEVKAPFGSRHRLENAVAAAAACYAAGLPMERCAAGLEDARFSGSRGDVTRLPGLVLIDDTYNASPAAVRAALNDLVDLARESGGRPVAILGDMLELGPDAADYHEAAGAYAAAAGVSALWGVGPLSRSTVEGFRRAWASETADEAEGTRAAVEAGNVRSADEASPVLAGLRRGDVVLLKASRSMGLEVLVRRIVEEAGAGTWADGSEVDAYRGGATEGSQT